MNNILASASMEKDMTVKLWFEGGEDSDEEGEGEGEGEGGAT